MERYPSGRFLCAVQGRRSRDKDLGKFQVSHHVPSTGYQTLPPYQQESIWGTCTVTKSVVLQGSSRCSYHPIYRVANVIPVPTRERLGVVRLHQYLQPTGLCNHLIFSHQRGHKLSLRDNGIASGCCSPSPRAPSRRVPQEAHLIPLMGYKTFPP